MLNKKRIEWTTLEWAFTCLSSLITNGPQMVSVHVKVVLFYKECMFAVLL